MNEEVRRIVDQHQKRRQLDEQIEPKERPERAEVLERPGSNSQPNQNPPEKKKGN